MVDKFVPSYYLVKDATYYFSRHVPIDLREHYSTSRIQLCLKTRSPHNAASAVKSINQKLDDYWMALRLSTMDNPALRFLKDRAVKPSSAPLLSEALDTYLRLKGSNKAPKKKPQTSYGSSLVLTYFLNLTAPKPSIDRPSANKNACGIIGTSAEWAKGYGGALAMTANRKSSTKSLAMPSLCVGT